MDFLPACRWSAAVLSAEPLKPIPPESSHCKCLHCKKLLVPDHRNRGRQKYCSDLACRRASKQASQQRWVRKPENRDYFRGPENVRRVQQWRKEHPGYWKRPAPPVRRTLQETCPAQPAAAKGLAFTPLPNPSRPALQDLCRVQTPLLVGLIAQFSDAALQEDIVSFTRRLIAKGQTILDQPSRRFAKGNTNDDDQKDPAPGPLAAGAGAV